MSRGFVKEGDQEEPVFVPPRAALPEGVVNYVTPEGLQMLERERIALEEQSARPEGENDTERRRTSALIDGKLRLLVERINSARVIDPKDQPEDEVRFGAVVRFVQNGKQPPVEFQIVGVDEADIKQRKVSFVAPVARALTGSKKGDVVSFDLGGEVRELEVLDIGYSK